MPSRCQRGVSFPAAARECRVPSISRPNGTPEGHAVSHPRHCTHASMNSMNEASAGASFHCTSRMAAMRPWGDAASSPLTR